MGQRRSTALLTPPEKGMSTTSSYPQAPPLTDEELAELLRTAEVARLATHNDDRSIHVAPLWFLYEPPDLLFGTQAVSRKVRNIERDPRVTVEVDVTSPALLGALIYGTARIERADATQRRVPIFRRYMDDGAAVGTAQALAAKYEAVILRVTPESVVSFDYRKGFPA
jgi:PPOX class probable F420-dependent enzyme